MKKVDKLVFNDNNSNEDYYNSELINDETEEEILDDEFEINYNVTERQVLTIENYIEDKILSIPPIQRPEVWDKRRKSKYIDSLLRGLPTPNLFLYENKKEDGLSSNAELIVVDGFQRITAINEFLKDELTLMKTASISDKWSGKTYSTLDQRYREKFKYISIPITYFYQNKPNSKSSISLIFERINTGSVQLTSQEIREAIFFSPFIEQVRKFDENINWLTLMVKNYSVDPESEDIKESYEKLIRKSTKSLSDRKSLILRYYMIKNDYELANSTGKITSGSLDKKLENICKLYSSLSEEESINLISEFNNIIDIILNKFGELAFYTPKDETEGISYSIHPTIFDSLVVAVGLGIENNEKIKEVNTEYLFRNLLYKEYEDIELNPFRKKTLTSQAIVERINIVKDHIYE